jgi:hypothetical protein
MAVVNIRESGLSSRLERMPSVDKWIAYFSKRREEDGFELTPRAKDKLQFLLIEADEQDFDYYLDDLISLHCIGGTTEKDYLLIVDEEELGIYICDLDSYMATYHYKR